MPRDPRFTAILEELKELHDKKSQDYGVDEDPYNNVRASADFGVEPWVGAMLRANDKMRRLMKYARRGWLANESARDSMRDIAVYAIIAIILYEEASESESAAVLSGSPNSHPEKAGQGGGAWQLPLTNCE